MPPPWKCRPVPATPRPTPLATSLYSSHPHQLFLNLCAVSPSSTGEKTFSIALSFISIGARLWRNYSFTDFFVTAEFGSALRPKLFMFSPAMSIASPFHKKVCRVKLLSHLVFFDLLLEFFQIYQRTSFYITKKCLLFLGDVFRFEFDSE